MITPNEYKTLLYKADDSLMERRIDQAIMDSTRMPIRISTYFFVGVQGDLAHVLHNYRQLGWCVETVTDWRGGDFIEMSIP